MQGTIYSCNAIGVVIKYGCINGLTILQ